MFIFLLIKIINFVILYLQCVLQLIRRKKMKSLIISFFRNLFFEFLKFQSLYFKIKILDNSINFSIHTLIFHLLLKQN